MKACSPDDTYCFDGGESRVCQDISGENPAYFFNSSSSLHRAGIAGLRFSKLASLVKKIGYNIHMSFRRARQLIYGAFFAALWYLVIAGGYYLFAKPAPTCFDNIKNQNETGVDCGGVCAKVCVPTGIRPITLLPGERVISYQTDSSHISFIAHIENPNSTYAARNFVYHILLYDDQDSLVATFSGSSFIYGGEIKYVLLPRVVLPGVRFSKVYFTVDTPAWISSSDFRGPPKFVVSSITPVVSVHTITVNGELTNRDIVTFPKASIVVIFTGQYGQVAGASQTEVEDIAPNQNVPFSVIYPAISDANLPATKVYVYAARP